MNKLLKTSALLSTALILGSTVAPLTADAAKYKTINWTEGADLGTMDPSKSTAAVDFDALQATGDGLYRNDKSGKPALALAESVEKSEDGLSLTFKLRSGLQWANGDALTAHDFVYGWQRTNDPKTASQYAYLFSGIKNADAIQSGENTDLSSLGVTAVDDTTLEVQLEKPMPQLESVLTMAPFYPQNQKFVEKVGKKYGTAAKYTLASGPYILKDWTGSNNKYSLVKNSKYYDAAVVKTPKVVVQTIKDQNTGYNLYKSGKVDFTNLSPDQVKASKKNKAYKVIPQASTFYMEFNQKKVKALANEKIRQAISYSIDRKTLSDKILTGTATPATTFTSTKLAVDPNTNEDFAKAAEVKGAIAYDKTKAKKLFKEGMKEAGVKKLTLQMVTDDTDGAKRTAQFLQSQMEKLDGLKIDIKTVPFKQRLALSQEKKFDLVITAWGADYGDPSTFLDLYTKDSSFNNGSWDNAQYNELMQAAKTTDVNDDKKRYDDYKQAEQIIDKEVGVAPLYYRSYATLFRTSVKGVVMNPAGAPYDWKWAYKK
ncbi:peptide ABC transporter substrate-binding protein [Weissella confusa]|uniref:peptide ABC transporter substrate-binding protein n=1 Tax=Weissella confusa TaxID=1583 RepID=UPI00024663DB|nr:peptide ABC transporter substrate-binding protein [Weissella confusa]KRN24656.1 ABC-type oligopeptide transport system, periplasmic component [Weissella confusa]MBD1491290.1 peptide ABC transporter substrate-binding protein [Weissella confusa]MBD9095420.1 peptide ABC transporter substrate-binding protein [Weissella confusa]MBJ7615184.1 peptide ABC transporter substrate-binding protein [Weissella confusa]MBJ7622606.1 peptide ABC transporter substrate-binding protein [Weissella confusa]